MADPEAVPIEIRVRGEALWLYRMLEPLAWYPAAPLEGDASSLVLHTPTGPRVVRREHFIVRERKPARGDPAGP